MLSLAKQLMQWRLNHGREPPTLQFAAALGGIGCMCF
jgi:hypothetical protein